MDYEKKYNDALERAKEYMAKGYDVLMPEIFPELAESEDERIRKEIRDFLIDMECKEEWVTYLENQKPAEWSEDDENALKYLHELIGFGFSENFMDAQTAADMRKWVNEKLKKKYRP